MRVRRRENTWGGGHGFSTWRATVICGRNVFQFFHELFYSLVADARMVPARSGTDRGLEAAGPAAGRHQASSDGARWTS